MRKARCFLFALILLPLSFPNLSASTLSFQSSSKKTNLVEIYTSEGCSSCPPAHQWISSFKNDPGLWKDFIPAVFHVDYWDQLGWKDKFDSPEYTERERTYSLWWGEPTLFTPCVVLNGRILQGWDRVSHFPPDPGSPGILTLDVLGQDLYQIHFEPSQKSFSSLTAHAVLLGLGIQSVIERGENSGQVLKHDFTVLDYQKAALESGNPTAQVKLQFSPLLPERLTPKRVAVAAWVTQGEDPSPIQAAGGELS